ncbi:DUF3551 domain-containing protein [Rhodopseudomonas pseudopalustris]|uniref:DUF3551 domain-containing protein n=1 Tax=Rhodopseudomonas pseudopalustris TaxID=1513892 RepID=UPI003F9C386A
MQEAVMRRVGLALVSCSAALLVVAEASAQSSAPYCLHVYGPITYDDCSYISMEQCRPSAVGRPAACMVNPFYTPPQQQRAKRHQQR